MTLQSISEAFLYDITPTNELPLDDTGPLNASNWAMRLKEHPDKKFANTLIRIFTHGAKIGYIGPESLFLAPNHSSASSAPDILTADLQKQIEAHRITRVTGKPTRRFISSPLGLVPKASGGWRRIHDLSHQGFSVNSFIPDAFGTLEYPTFDDALDALITQGRGAMLVKRDLQDAFRHMPVARSDWWLLGFYWDDHYYFDRFLPFGLRTSPFLFDLLAKALHWILMATFHWSIILHYLDDFFAILDPDDDAARYQSDFDTLCLELGIKVNIKKNVCSTTAEFLGIELDSMKMEARLPANKLAKARKAVEAALGKDYILHADLQSLVGFLSFAAKVVSPGRSFLRRLFDALKVNTLRHRVTRCMRLDLLWWHKFLPIWNGIRLLRPHRDRFYIWTDASGRFGLGGYIASTATGQPIDCFSHRFPSRMRHKHINVKEMLAVLFAMRRWLGTFKGAHVTIRCDNNAVANGLKNRSIRGGAMAPLRDICMLLAQHDIVIDVIWIPTKANALADMLSRGLYARIANTYPQLTQMLCRRTPRPPGTIRPA